MVRIFGSIIVFLDTIFHTLALPIFIYNLLTIISSIVITNTSNRGTITSKRKKTRFFHCSGIEKSRNMPTNTNIHKLCAISQRMNTATQKSLVFSCPTPKYFSMTSVRIKKMRIDVVIKKHFFTLFTFFFSLLIILPCNNTYGIFHRHCKRIRLTYIPIWSYLIRISDT